jgi:hypothetical protein
VPKNLILVSPYFRAIPCLRTTISHDNAWPGTSATHPWRWIVCTMTPKPVKSPTIREIMITQRQP